MAAGERMFVHDKISGAVAGNVGCGSLLALVVNSAGTELVLGARRGVQDLDYRESITTRLARTYPHTLQARQY